MLNFIRQDEEVESKSMEFVNDLIKRAQESVVLFDNYIDESVLTLFNKNKNIDVTIYLIFPLGLRFNTLPHSKKFSSHFKLQFSYDYDNRDYYLLGFWGMRYKLLE